MPASIRPSPRQRHIDPFPPGTPPLTNLINFSTPLCEGLADRPGPLAQPEPQHPHSCPGERSPDLSDGDYFTIQRKDCPIKTMGSRRELRLSSRAFQAPWRTRPKPTHGFRLFECQVNLAIECANSGKRRSSDLSSRLGKDAEFSRVGPDRERNCEFTDRINDEGVVSSDRLGIEACIELTAVPWRT
jgi:hypothetical protein